MIWQRLYGTTEPFSSRKIVPHGEPSVTRRKKSWGHAEIYPLNLIFTLRNNLSNFYAKFTTLICYWKEKMSLKSCRKIPINLDRNPGDALESLPRNRVAILLVSCWVPTASCPARGAVFRDWAWTCGYVTSTCNSVHESSSSKVSPRLRIPAAFLRLGVLM